MFSRLTSEPLPEKFKVGGDVDWVELEDNYSDEKEEEKNSDALAKQQNIFGQASNSEDEFEASTKFGPPRKRQNPDQCPECKQDWHPL